MWVGTVGGCVSMMVSVSVGGVDASCASVLKEFRERRYINAEKKAIKSRILR